MVHRLRVFVAMRIGDSETDAVYATIAAAIRNTHGTPVRIDKIEHNDNIDDRIVKEILRADLLVADLTFARPSVYFEAGFAEGQGIPVIYTSRSDHFEPKQADALGNERIHFDLQMRNIIGWRNGINQGFRKRLERRLVMVSRPIVRRLVAASNLRDEERAFASLSAQGRRSALLHEAVSWAEGNNFVGSRVVDAPRHLSLWRFLPTNTRTDIFDANDWIGLRERPGAIEAVLVCCGENLSMARLKQIGTLVTTATFHDVNPPGASRPNRILEHICLVSVRSLRDATINVAFPTFARVDESTLGYKTAGWIPAKNIPDKVIFTGVNPYGQDSAVVSDGSNRWDDQEFRIRDGFMLEETHGPVVLRYPRELKPQPQPLARVREVPRAVFVHVLAPVNSETTLRERLNSVGTVLRRTSRASGARSSY
jgi:nucleoside 2-deoxyribosyltransferase